MTSIEHIKMCHELLKLFKTMNILICERVYMYIILYYQFIVMHVNGHRSHFN